LIDILLKDRFGVLVRIPVTGTVLLKIVYDGEEVEGAAPTEQEAILSLLERLKYAVERRNPEAD
jgi:hypothetical protein